MAQVACEFNCDDEGADQRHEMLAMLAGMGVEGDEMYIGAGNTVIEIPSDDGVWWFTNLFDAVPVEWSATLSYEPGHWDVQCKHDLGDLDQPLEVVARQFVDECLMARHQPNHVGTGVPFQG